MERYEMVQTEDKVKVGRQGTNKKNWSTPVKDTATGKVYFSLTDAAVELGLAVGTLHSWCKRGESQVRLATRTEIIEAFGEPTNAESVPNVGVFSVDRGGQVWVKLPGHEQWNKSANTADELRALGHRKARKPPTRNALRAMPAKAPAASSDKPFVCATWPDGAVTVRLRTGGSWSMTRPSVQDLPPEITVAMIST